MPRPDNTVPGQVNAPTQGGGIMAAMRFFNTAGPVRADLHYLIPPLERWDLDEILMLIRQQKYFILHAPRQSGKTSVLLALRDLLNEGAAGELRCFYANLEAGQTGGEDVEKAMRAILVQIAREARLLGDDFPRKLWKESLDKAGPLFALNRLLTRWSMADARPLVLLLDEVDSLVGDTLNSVLRQLRSGYPRRPSAFPQSVLLCGVRDVRKSRFRANPGKEITPGGVPFNISAASIRLADFDEARTRALLGQHTAETGQAFLPDAQEAVWTQTCGQPWLVNALAYEACFKNRAGRDRSRPISGDDILAAGKELIRRRDTHLHQLADKLEDERVQRIVEPMLAGSYGWASDQDDIEYVRGLGLIAPDAPLRIANPIYAEVVPRELTRGAQAGLVRETAWYVRADGGLDVPKLLGAFQEFFREHSERWVEHFQYREAAPQLLLQAFCQRIVDGRGRVEREYGLGRERVDLLLLWPQAGRRQKFVVEYRLLRDGLETTLRKGLEQTAGYMDRCGAEAGHLVVFDRGSRKPWAEKIWRREEAAPDGRTITVWGM